MTEKWNREENKNLTEYNLNMKNDEIYSQVNSKSKDTNPHTICFIEDSQF